MPAKLLSCEGCEHLLTMRGVPHADFTGEQYFCAFNVPPLDSNRPGEWLGFLPTRLIDCPLEVFGEGYAGVYRGGQCGPDFGAETFGEVVPDDVGDGIPGDQGETGQREVPVDDSDAVVGWKQRALAFD